MFNTFSTSPDEQSQRTVSSWAPWWASLVMAPVCSVLFPMSLPSCRKDTDLIPSPAKMIRKVFCFPEKYPSTATAEGHCSFLWWNCFPLDKVHSYRKNKSVSLVIKVLTVKMVRKDSRTWYATQENRKLTVVHLPEHFTYKRTTYWIWHISSSFIWTISLILWPSPAPFGVLTMFAVPGFGTLTCDVLTQHLKLKNISWAPAGSIAWHHMTGQSQRVSKFAGTSTQSYLHLYI